MIYKEGEVFYNPLQEFNRDISVAAIQQFIKLLESEKPVRSSMRNVFICSNVEPKPYHRPTDNGITILEGLSATGLRSIRYYKEIEGIETIFANDLCADAYITIKRNLVCSPSPCS